MCARLSAKSVAHLVDEFNFSGFSNQATLEFSNNMQDVTAFADTDETFVEGKPGFTFNVQGLLDLIAGGYDAEMFLDLTVAARKVGIYPGGLADGNFGYEGDTLITESPRVAEVGGAAALNVTWRGNTPAVRSVMLDVDTARGTSGNGTSYEYGAALAADTIVGTLRLLAAPAGAGNNTLDIIIQSDTTGFPSPTTRLTFAQLTQASVATFEVVTAAGAVTDTFWRVNYVYAGVGSRTFSVVITFGIKKT